LLIGLFSTSQSPVKDEPSRARITSKRRLLFGGRINYEAWRQTQSPRRAEV
jgi:hypothetical protein